MIPHMTRLLQLMPPVQEHGCALVVVVVVVVVVASACRSAPLMREALVARLVLAASTTAYQITGVIEH